MASEVTICSNALLKLGAPAITSLTEATQAARLCQGLWTQVRDAVLRDHPWNCATKRIQIAPDATAPTWGYTYQFTIPADCLRIMEVDGTTDYRVESGKILCNDTGINLKYIWRNTDTTTYDALLTDAMIQRMAAELAYPVTKSSTQQQLETQKYSAILKSARSVDASEQAQEDFIDYPLISTRFI